jgi:hypothetical protein
MDEAQLKQTIDAHANAVVDPLDIEHIQSDLIADLHPQIPVIAQLLPIPVKTATVDTLDIEADHAIATITYTGDEGAVSMRSRWEQRDGTQAQMVHAEPVS